MENIGCIEVKCLLSTNKSIKFPDKSSKRIKEQLKCYNSILLQDVPVTFSFISMSSDLVEFRWSDNDDSIKYNFIRAVQLGMKIEAFSVVLDNGAFKLVENSELKYNILSELIIDN